MQALLPCRNPGKFPHHSLCNKGITAEHKNISHVLKKKPHQTIIITCSRTERDRQDLLRHATVTRATDPSSWDVGRVSLAEEQVLPLQKTNYRSWWLLAPRGRLLFYPKHCKYNTGSLPSELRKPIVLSSESSGPADPDPRKVTLRKQWVTVVRWLPAAGDKGTHLLTWPVVYRSLLLAVSPDLGCCGEITKACPTPWLVLPGVLMCGHQWYRWGNIGSIKGNCRALGVTVRGMGIRWYSQSCQRG